VRGDPKKFGGKDGGLRIAGDDPDDVLERLVMHINHAFLVVDDNADACRLCALIEPDQANDHRSDDHEEEE
jgi:hypothetical protein